MFVVGVSLKILSLSADSLQRMADAVRFEKVHNHMISSLVFSMDGKYHLFTLIMYLCINYELYEDMLLREARMDQWRFSIRKVANV